MSRKDAATFARNETDKGCMSAPEATTLPTATGGIR